MNNFPILPVSPKHPHKNVGTLGTAVAEKLLNDEKHTSAQPGSMTSAA
jgi:hypothetical protein